MHYNTTLMLFKIFIHDYPFNDEQPLKWPEVGGFNPGIKDLIPASKI